MVINKITKQFQIRSDKQNENWLNEEWIAIDDNSEFAQTIVNNYPNVIITIENNIVANVEIDNTKIEQENKNKEIIILKEQLNATDYKIIKASEYNLLGLECEYDIQELHTERQRIRNRINELEGSN